MKGSAGGCWCCPWAVTESLTLTSCFQPLDSTSRHPTSKHLEVNLSHCFPSPSFLLHFSPSAQDPGRRTGVPSSPPLTPVSSLQSLSVLLLTVLRSTPRSGLPPSLLALSVHLDRPRHPSSALYFFGTTESPLLVNTLVASCHLPGAPHCDLCCSPQLHSRWPSNTQCLLSSLRPGGEPGRALTQAPGEAGRGHGLTPSPQIQGPGGAAPRPGVHMALSPPEITAPTASRGGGRGACAQGAKLGWDRRETHSHPGNGLFPRSSLPPNSQNTLHRLQTETAASSETTATAITASGAGPSPVQTRGQERVLAACLPVKPQHEFSFPRTVRSLLAPKVA